MIGRAIAILESAGYDLTAREIADIFWLAIHLEPLSGNSSQGIIEPSPQSSIINPDLPLQQSDPLRDTPTQTETYSDRASVVLPPSPSEKSNTKENREAIPIKIPTAVALRNTMALGRALRPLMRKVPSSIERILDEEATIKRFVEDRIGIPVLKNAPERWLEIALVFEETSITEIWRQTILEFQRLLAHHGAFRNVRTWKLKVAEKVDTTSHQSEIQLFAQNSTGFDESTSHKPDILIDPQGRRLILLISDCISPIWRKKLIHPFLELWGKRGLITILQLLPERLWDRTALVDEIPVLLSALNAGVNNSQLIAKLWDEDDMEEFMEKGKSEIFNSLISIPIITLEPESLLIWSQVIAGKGNISTAGFKFSSIQETEISENLSIPTNQLSANQLVNLFRANASVQARRLAGLMSAVPVSISVINLIQQTLLPDSTQIHVAEVFMSGLLKRLPVSHQDSTEYITYEFVDGVRELLRDFVPRDKQISVLDEVSNFIAKRFGLSVKEFNAQLLTYQDNAKIASKLRPFAQIKAQVLHQLGGEYARVAEEIEKNQHKRPTDFRGGLVNIESPSLLSLQPFVFQVATIELKGSELEVTRTFGEAMSFVEDLGNGVQLEMVSIPGGTFIMGSPEYEKDSKSDERPEHKVRIKPFFLGKYQVTQAQWKEVANFFWANRQLNPDPSRFKGANRPVECVSWIDAVNFCVYLSKHTLREYRLPSEAEWEYACRAGTTKAFHFGQTITTDLANYDGNSSNYINVNEVKGLYRKETTEVGSFGVANKFGLYDMHGNVREWCQDHYHSSYKAAPTDGSAWEYTYRDRHTTTPSRVLRGGAWNYDPRKCRSAFRLNNDMGDRFFNIGFRVVCSGAKIM